MGTLSILFPQLLWETVGIPPPFFPSSSSGSGYYSSSSNLFSVVCVNINGVDVKQVQVFCFRESYLKTRARLCIRAYLFCL